MDLQTIRLLLFLTAFIVLPFGATHFETPKVIIAELIIQALAIRFFWHKHIDLRFLKTYWPFCVVILLSVIQLLLYSSSLMFFGNPFRLQGTFMLLNLLLLAIVVSEKDTKPVNAWLPFFTLMALAGSVFFYGLNKASRAVGALGEPNALAALALFCFPFAIIGVPAKKKRLVWFFACVAMAIILIMTKSRSAAVAFMLELMFLSMIRLKIFTLQVSTILAFLACIASMVFPFFDSARIYENRVEIWETGIHAAIRQFFSGWGFGNTEYALQWSSYAISNNLRYQYVDSAHNIFMDWFIQGGVIGLFILVYLLIRATINFVKMNRISETTALIGVTTALLFNPSSVVVLVAFWWLIGRGYLVKKLH